MDLIEDERLNPRRAIFLTPIGALLGGGNFCGLELPLRLLRSKAPLGNDYFEAVEAYMGKVAPRGDRDDSRGWYAEIPFPFSLETLSATIHELSHISDEKIEQEDTQIKSLFSQLPEGGMDNTDKAKEVIRRINSIQAGQENRAQMKTLNEMLQLAREWGLPDYKRRLRQLLVLEWEFRRREGIL